MERPSYSRLEETEHESALDYARLHEDGTLGRVVTFARQVETNYAGNVEMHYAVNDPGQFAAAWVHMIYPGPMTPHGHSMAMVVCCSAAGACREPSPVSLGKGRPEDEEVGLALSDNGSLSVMLVECSEPYRGLWGATASAGALLGPTSSISRIPRLNVRGPSVVSAGKSGAGWPLSAVHTGREFPSRCVMAVKAIRQVNTSGPLGRTRTTRAGSQPTGPAARRLAAYR